MANNTPHSRQLKIDLGGLYRCCLITLNTTLLTENEGDTLQCRYCNATLIVKDNVWQWEPEKDSNPT